MSDPTSWPEAAVYIVTVVSGMGLMGFMMWLLMRDGDR